MIEIGDEDEDRYSEITEAFAKMGIKLAFVEVSMDELQEIMNSRDPFSRMGPEAN